MAAAAALSFVPASGDGSFFRFRVLLHQRSSQAPKAFRIGEKFEAGLPLTDGRVFDPATDAFSRIPAEAQPAYLEMAEIVYRAVWQALRPAIAEKVGETLEIPGLGELAGAGEITELEDAAMEILADLKDLLSDLSGGLAGEKPGPV